MSYQAYQRAAESAEPPRMTERRVFGMVNVKLQRAAEARGTPGHVGLLAEACHDNRRLWTVLVADLMTEGNRLPPELKRNLLGLGAWVQSYTPKVLLGKGRVEELIEINRTIMEGLARQPAESPGPVAAGPISANA